MEVKNEVTSTFLNEENYEQVLEMLVCADEGSSNVALSLIEHVNYKESEIFILCILKQANDKVSGIIHSVKDKAPMLYASLQENTGSDVLEFTFRSIYEIAIKRSVKSETKFLLNIFKGELTTLLTNYGFTFLDYLEIEIKEKQL